MLRRLLRTLYSGVDDFVLAESSYCLSTHQQSNHFSLAKEDRSSLNIHPWRILDPIFKVELEPQSCDDYPDNLSDASDAPPLYPNITKGLSSETMKHLSEISADARRKYYRFDEFLRSSNRSISNLLRALSFRLHLKPSEWCDCLAEILSDCPEEIVKRVRQMVIQMHY